jgi:hypothetical protein
MRISYLDLISDDLPAFVVEDWIDVMDAEHDKRERDRREAEREARRNRR